MKHHVTVILVLAAVLMASCSTTRRIPEGEQLYTGISSIDYGDCVRDSSFYAMQEELEASVDLPPNGAVLGSSKYRTPFQLRLWIWNAFSGGKNGISKWITKSFGKEPVLISKVKPEVRAKVAETVLHAHGYMHGTVKAIKQEKKNSKKCKIKYEVRPGILFTIDSMEYVGFTEDTDSMIRATRGSALVDSGKPFSVMALDGERTRLAKLFRNNGYYYYQPAFTTYYADTLSRIGGVHLRMQMVKGLPDNAVRQWNLGKMHVDLMRHENDRPANVMDCGDFTMSYSGKKPKLRPSVIRDNLDMHEGDRFSSDSYSSSSEKLNSLGIFGITNFSFSPRDTTAECSVLDTHLQLLLEKPYDFSAELNYTAKTNGCTGPGVKLGITKRNAFKGAEELSFNVKGSYEWQTKNRINGGGGSDVNSYEYGADVTLQIPRFVSPLFRNAKFHTTPSTTFKVSLDILNRAQFFKIHTVSGELTYKFQTSPQITHEFSPLIIDYNYLKETTAKFDSISAANPALYISMRNQFVPKLHYKFQYISEKHLKNPIKLEVAVTEAGNLLSTGYMAFGKGWGDKDKELFKNPYAQFFKLRADFTKTWSLGRKSKLVGNLSGGVIYSYGNSTTAPYSEQFYVGGANSVRAFAVRSIGPGSSMVANNKYSYLDQTGDMMLQANLEYRFNMFDNLYGAVFLDAGNVWLLRDKEDRPGGKFRPKNFFKEMATGTGIGIRYDMEFLVIRLDWGIGIHVPYETSRSGYYNIPKFSDGQNINFAIGYPF